MSDQENVKHDGKFKKSWKLLKGSWKAMRMDKEMVSFPIINAIIAFIVLAIAGVIAFVARDSMFILTKVDGGGDLEFKALGNIFFAVIILILGSLSMIFSGAVMHGALERFRGNDPTVKGSFKAALARGGSLLGFGLFSTLIGYIISEIAERIPFIGGKVIMWLAGSAWNVASFFAVPVIVSSDQPINPVQATKKSIELIKKTWGESLIVSLGISIIASLSFVIYATLIAVVIVALVGMQANGWVIGAAAAFSFIGLVAMILIYSVLEAFAKAAIYFYATTGEAPAHFDERMMRAAFTPKKARKLFKSA